MARPFPTDNPFFRGRFAPLSFEADAHDLPISGTLPEELLGTLYRNGPNPQYAPPGPHHWFQGDGMIHAFQFDRGRVFYRNRWIRTPKWELERSLGQALRADDPRLVALNSTLANTNVVWHGQRLLALEEGHCPFEMDPATLESRGNYDFGGALPGPTAAHPKIDPITGDLLAFGYSLSGPFSPDARFATVDRSGRVLGVATLTLPYGAMLHDLAITRRWVVFPVFPLTGSLERANAGGPPLAWEPAKGTHFGFMPREGGDVFPGDAHWIHGDPCHAYHFMNAFDAPDGTVVVDAMKYPVAPLFPLADGTMPEVPPTACLVRWTFEPRGRGRGWREEVIDGRPGEFPRIDDRFACLPYRHGYFCAGAKEGAQEGGGIAHIDFESRRVREWRPGEGDVCDEPVFVPRSRSAPEGDGWLLSVVYRHAEKRSDLLVFDARDISGGPIATVHLAHRVPAGFHGNFRPGPLVRS